MNVKKNDEKDGGWNSSCWKKKKGDMIEGKRDALEALPKPVCSQQAAPLASAAEGKILFWGKLSSHPERRFLMVLMFSVTAVSYSKVYI